MSKSTDVAVPTATLPALAATPASAGISASDIALPKLYRGEKSSNAVENGYVPKGCIYIASGADDPDPQVVAQPDDEVGILMHVLDMKKGKSITVDGDLQTFAFDDPEAPAEAWVTYQYVVALPEIDTDIPVKLLLTKTSAGAAKRINFLLLKNQGQPFYSEAFRLTVKSRDMTKGSKTHQWYVWTEKKVDAEPKNVAIAAKVAELIAGQPTNDIERTGDAAPAI